jgi:hypothetical protein
MRMQKQSGALLVPPLADKGHAAITHVWDDMKSVQKETGGLRVFENSARFWDSLEVALISVRHKPTGVCFLFPRSAKSLEVKIHDMRGKIVRGFKVSSLWGGANNLKWDGMDNDGAAVPPGNYVVKAAAHNFEQSIRIAVENFFSKGKCDETK